MIQETAMLVANAIVAVLGAYLVCGLLFAIYFVKNVGRIDHAARGTSILFRLLLIPGAAALWPFLIARCKGATT